MDNTDEKILDLLKGDARMSYQQLGDAIGMTRVAAKKRVMKLERDGIIRGYNTYIKRMDDVMMIIDIVTSPGKIDNVLQVLCNRTAFIRQIYKTTKENHIHALAVSDDVSDLKYLTRIIQKQCGDDITEFHCHAVKEIIKDVYGGIGYDPKSESDINGNNKSD